MSTREADDTDHIVASGEALSVVSKWLGLSSFQDALAADPYQNSTIFEEPRPPLLGLGADPRKYHKTLSTASKLERRLGQRLKGRDDNQQAPADMDRNGRRESVEEASEEEEEEGRAGAIQKRQRPLQQDMALQSTKKRKRKKIKA
ncbi:hypothetical protein COCOBI_03-6010 [Coccomyxa sp. Obi]|nr:hypothetical protein COCOBI_03-6010 [Coccomyxa sp. Obi]